MSPRPVLAIWRCGGDGGRCGSPAAQILGPHPKRTRADDILLEYWMVKWVSIRQTIQTGAEIVDGRVVRHHSTAAEFKESRPGRLWSLEARQAPFEPEEDDLELVAEMDDEIFVACLAEKHRWLRLERDDVLAVYEQVRGQTRKRRITKVVHPTG